MSSHFWTDGDEQHQEIARTFYENIEYEQPKYVTSRGLCPCLEYTRKCTFPLEGRVEYPEYTGPRITNI